MNIHELSTYNLADAVKFHRRLNPRIWGRDEHLLPEVREKLLAIAEDFQEFLGVEDLNVKDITISGSNAAYSYTKNSDIDLHLVVEMPADPVYQELFNAKKYQYNDEHNIKIGGADVELYVQPADQTHISQGIYSVQDNNWISVPRRKRAQIDDACVRDKVADLDARIHDAVRSQDESKIATLADKIKAMRQAGLEQQGEFGCENLAFKMLRNSGCIKLLWDARRAAQDRELSLREADRPQQRFRYGFSEGHQGQPYSSEDGVAASTKQFLENSESDDNIVQDFIQQVTTELGIDPVPKIHLHTDPKWSEHNQSFGRYDPESHTLNVSMPNRHVMDVLRTVAHELVHCSQNQQHGELPDDAGETGSDWENDANTRAGIIMRDWANSHPEHFAYDSLEENASGYIPKNKKEAARPQYAMALSVDIKPGEVGRQANKLALNTGRNGEPGLLMKTVNLREYRMPQPSHGPGAIRDLNEPLGPETPPEMPDGTIKVDVSDMYDWYKLGQKISDLDSIKPGELGAGPPSTVFAFGSEDLENMYSHELTRLGLKTHDLDEPGEEDVDEGQVREDIEDFPIANVRRANGAIGNQGVNIEQAADVLTHAAGMQVSPDMSMRQLVDALKADPAAQQRLRQFVQKNPITVSALPDGSYHLQDGHHRTFLLNLLGDETVPAVVKEGVAEGESNAMVNTASRLANKDDGKVAKLRAAGDKRREDQLKGRDIARRDRTSKDEWGYLKQGVAEGLTSKQPGEPVVDAIQKVMPIAQEIWFHGSRATGKHRRNSDTDILVVVPDDFVGDQYLAVVRTLQKLSSIFDNYDIQPTKSGTNIHRMAQEEGRLLWSSKQGVAESENNDTAISLSKLGKFHPGADSLAEFVPERATAQYALHPDKWESTFYSLTNKDSDKLKYYGPKKISIPPGTLVGDMAIANKFYRAKTPEEKQQYAELYKASLQPYPIDVSQYRMPELLIPRQGVAEAPLADYQPIGDFDKPGPFRGADKKLIPHPVNQLKAQRFFEKTPYNFRLFFSNIPGTGKYSEYGIMDPDTVKIIFGDAGEQIVAGHENAITVVYVGNSGDSKVMLTPWMMAHRLGHAIQVGARGQMRNQQQPWKAGEDHFFGQVNSMLEEYYGKSGQPGGNLKAELTPEYNALFNAMGTQRSSRSGEIRRPYEFLYEIFAQYLGTGTVTFNALPANLGYGRRVWGNPSRYLNIKPEYRDETVRKQAAEVLSYDMELMFNDALSNVEGKILVM